MTRRARAGADRAPEHTLAVDVLRHALLHDRIRLMLTLVARLDRRSAPTLTEPAWRIRATRTSDLEELGALYFASYDPGIACATLDEAIADVAASLRGEYGGFWYDASPVVETAGGIVAAVMTVHRAPWDDAPDSPFIIELFTARSHRRRGLARTLLEHCMATLHDAGESTVALRVSPDNAPARQLYDSLGFVAAD